MASAHNLRTRLDKADEGEATLNDNDDKLKQKVFDSPRVLGEKATVPEDDDEVLEEVRRKIKEVQQEMQALEEKTKAGNISRWG